METILNFFSQVIGWLAGLLGFGGERQSTGGNPVAGPTPGVEENPRQASGGGVPRLRRQTADQPSEPDRGQVTYMKPDNSSGEQGLKRLSDSNVTPEMRDAAVAVLARKEAIGTQDNLGMMKGRDGQMYDIVAVTEVHHDNHPHGGTGPAFDHPGVSLKYRAR